MRKKCTFQKSDGTKCQANAQSDKPTCCFHDATRKEQGRQARRAGGMTRSKPAVVLPTHTPDARLENTSDVSKVLAETINQIRRGELDPRIGNAVGYLAGVLLRALEQGDLEARLEKLEARLSPDQTTANVA
jgi:hypothetical protein